MADRVLPIVRLLVPCQEAHHDADSGEVVILNPWAVMGPPDGTGFPFDADEIWVYAQVTDGVGTFGLAVEVRQVYDDDRPDRAVGRGGAVTLAFPGGSQLAVYDVAFRITAVPFDEPGLYEFRVLAGDEALEGHTVTIRMLDVGAE